MKGLRGEGVKGLRKRCDRGVRFRIGAGGVMLVKNLNVFTHCLLFLGVDGARLGFFFHRYCACRYR